jgi:hypothetical protein
LPLDEDGRWVLVADEDALPLTPEEIAVLLSRPLRAWPIGVAANLDEVRSGLHLWLVAHEPSIFTLWAGSQLPDLFGLAERAGAHGSLCLLDAGEPSLALLAWADDSAGAGELSVLSARQDDAVAVRLRSLVNEWASRGRPMDTDVEVRACLHRPVDGEPGPNEVALDQRWTRFVLSWPNRRPV